VASSAFVYLIEKINRLAYMYTKIYISDVAQVQITRIYILFYTHISYGIYAHVFRLPHQDTPQKSEIIQKWE